MSSNFCPCQIPFVNSLPFFQSDRHGSRSEFFSRHITYPVPSPFSEDDFFSLAYSPPAQHTFLSKAFSFCRKFTSPPPLVLSADIRRRFESDIFNSFQRAILAADPGYATWEYALRRQAQIKLKLDEAYKWTITSALSDPVWCLVEDALSATQKVRIAQLEKTYNRLQKTIDKILERDELIRASKPWQACLSEYNKDITGQKAMALIALGVDPRALPISDYGVNTCVAVRRCSGRVATAASLFIPLSKSSDVELNSYSQLFSSREKQEDVWHQRRIYPINLPLLVKFMAASKEIREELVQRRAHVFNFLSSVVKGHSVLNRDTALLICDYIGDDRLWLHADQAPYVIRVDSSPKPLRNPDNADSQSAETERVAFLTRLNAFTFGESLSASEEEKDEEKEKGQELSII